MSLAENPRPVLPGASIGILGGGQLARMLALAARPLGYGVVVLDPDPNCPAAAVADRVIVAAYDDAQALRHLAESVAVVTLEFENIPSHALLDLSLRVPLRPSPQVLGICRDRAKEKTFLAGIGVPIAPWALVDSHDSLEHARHSIPTASILKTNTLGYDGKGQVRLERASELPQAWETLGRVPCVLESQVKFVHEASVIVARSFTGEIRAFPPIHNVHVGGVLNTSVWAGKQAWCDEAVEVATRVTRSLEAVGLLAVELFVTRDNWVMVNELAPRPHNSGHLTIEGAAISQFQQAIRAVCGLPLGAVLPTTPTAMVNLLGDLWEDGEPQWAKALELGGVNLHLYGKREARNGRKMGHLSAIANDNASALQRVLNARDRALGRMGL
jgi:5-(carboxyamino)imidazole ribonucleotide synthase